MHNIQHMRMASLAFSALFICTFLATVYGQTPVVSTSTITKGEKFSFYCDSTRVTTPAGVGNIYSLTLNRTVTGGNSVQIAQYISLAPPGVITVVKNPPTGRQWNFTFTGANNGVNNLGTMRIAVDVNDAQCSDAGVYYCQIEYFPISSGASPPPAVSPGHNVTASMGLSEFGLTADPDMDVYQADDNVTFTCTAKGPSTGVSFRWEFWVEDNFGLSQQNSLPNNAAPVTSPATLLPGNAGCQLYSWVSTVIIQVPSDYEFQTYKCIVSYQQQQLSGNKTIGTTVSEALSPVVSTSIINTRDRFSLYCDSTRVSAPPGSRLSINSLALYRNVTDGKYTLIAQYTSVTPPGENAEIKNPPNGRQWDFTFSGANGGTNNMGTMRIVVDVNDAQCSDAGVYYCQIVYFYPGGGTSPPALSPGQNVTASMGPSNVSLTADPDLYDYEEDDNVTFTCTATEPSAAVTFKWVLYVTDQFGELSQLIFPNNAAPVTNPPTLQPGNTGCPQYSWVSTLSIQVPPSHRFQLYMCILDQQENAKTVLKTISVIPRGTQTSTPLLQMCTTPSSQAMALRKRRTTSALEWVLLLLASILLVEHPYVRVLPVSCLSCLIVGTLCA